MRVHGIIKLSELQQDRLVDDCRVCHYCREPFKECDTLIPGVGVIIGETDVVKWKNRFWHHGCIYDWLFMQGQDF
jgi:hypothetical protein